MSLIQRGFDPDTFIAVQLAWDEDKDVDLVEVSVYGNGGPSDVSLTPQEALAVANAILRLCARCEAPTGVLLRPKGPVDLGPCVLEPAPGATTGAPPSYPLDVTRRSDTNPAPKRVSHTK